MRHAGGSSWAKGGSRRWRTCSTGDWHVSTNLRSTAIICSVPDRSKARAVRATLEGPVTPIVPASILQRHPQATISSEPQSAGLLGPRTT